MKKYIIIVDYEDKVASFKNYKDACNFMINLKNDFKNFEYSIICQDKNQIEELKNLIDEEFENSFYEMYENYLN